MTTETRVVFGPEDFAAVRIVCKNCQHESVYNVASKEMGKLVQACPWCNRAWLGKNETEWRRLESLLTALLRIQQSEEYAIKFEMIAPAQKRNGGL